MKKQTLLKAFRFLTLLCLMCLGTNAWGQTVTTYTFTSKSWADANKGWTSDKDGYQYSSPNVQITSAFSGAGATSNKSYTNISKIRVSASTTNKGIGNITVKVGDGAAQQICSLSKVGASAKWYELTYSTPVTGKVTFVVNCSTNSMYMQAIEITNTEDENQVETPTFSVDASGTFFDTQNVEISTKTDDATIYYTTDGSTPSSSSTEYTSAVEISSTTTLKAIAVKTDMKDSEVATATYTFGPVFNSLEELVAADITSGTTVKVTFENQPIKDFYTYKGNRNGIYFDIQKEDNDIEIYYNGVPTTWVVGGMVSGTMTCPWTKYESTWELAPKKDSWSWENLTYTDRTLQSITVSGTPTKTVYENGDEFDPDGLVVTGTYNIGEPEVITEGISWTFDPETLSANETSCKVKATVNEIESDWYTVNGLTVNATRTLTSIVISGTPTKTVYEVGDTFNPAGLTVTANYNIGDPTDVSNEAEFTFDDTPLAFGTTSVNVYATYNETESAVFACPITVNKKEAAITIADMEVSIGDEVAISATTTPAEAALTYSVTSGSEFITLNGNKITGVAAGTAVVNAHFDGDAEYAEANKSFNVTVTAIKTATKTGFVSGDNTGEHNVGTNADITFQAYKGNAGTAPAINNGNLRLYQNGGYVKLRGGKGVKIQSVKVTSSASYATTVGIAVDANCDTKPSSGEALAKSSSYTFTSLNNDSVALYCLGTTSSTRLEIAALEVKYLKEDLPAYVENITLSGKYQTAFYVGDEFNHTGLVVTANYSDETTQDVTSEAIVSTPDMTQLGTQQVTVSYEGDDDTFYAYYNITISVQPGVLDKEGVNFSELGYTETMDMTKNPYNGGTMNITFAQGTSSNAPKYYTTGESVRVYAGNTINIQAIDPIYKVEIQYTTQLGADNAATVSTGTLYIDSESKLGTWAVPYAQDITCTTGKASFNAITVFYKGGRTVTIPGTAETEEDCGMTTLYVDYATAIPAECKAYYAGSAAEGQVNLVKAEDYVAANEGVLVYGKKGASFTFAETAEEVAAPAANLFVGSTTTSETPCVASDNIFYLSTDGTFKQLVDGTRKAYKAYLHTEVAPGTKGFTLNFDEETSINDVNDNVNVNVIYNLGGQKINKLQKGINIVNGKKVLF